MPAKTDLFRNRFIMAIALQIARNAVGSDMSAMKYQSDIQSSARWSVAAMRSHVALLRICVLETLIHALD